MRRVITSVLTLDVATMFAVRGSMFSSALSPKNAPSLSAPTTFSPAFSPAAFRSSRVASAVPPTTMKSATVWRLGSIWVTPEGVLRPPQLKTDEDSAAAAGPHVWTSPPVRIPSNMTTDAPLLGNGELGVAHGGDLASGNLTFFFAVSIHRLKSTVSRGFVLTSMPRCIAGQLLLERAGRRHLTVRLSRRGRALHE